GNFWRIRNRQTQRHLGVVAFEVAVDLGQEEPLHAGIRIAAHVELGPSARFQTGAYAATVDHMGLRHLLESIDELGTELGRQGVVVPANIVAYVASCLPFVRTHSPNNPGLARASASWAADR